MNKISDNIKKGTLGEILVQLRLLQYGVQAAPPLKDTGNDLIAIKGNNFKAIQVKTTEGNMFNLRLSELNERLYHILALVKLEGENQDVYLDKSRIFLLRKEELLKTSYKVRELEDKQICQNIIEDLF